MSSAYIQFLLSIFYSLMIQNSKIVSFFQYKFKIIYSIIFLLINGCIISYLIYSAKQRQENHFVYQLFDYVKYTLNTLLS